MADDDDLTPFMDSGADYVAGQGAAGAFDPDTYFGPKLREESEQAQLFKRLSPSMSIPPSLVEALGGATDKKPSKDNLDDQLQQVIQNLVEGQGRVSAEGRGILEEQKSGTRSVIQALDESRQRMANVPQPELQKPPPPPQAALGQGAMQWMQIATLLGAMGGAFMRRGTTTALTAFAGAVKGFAEGRKEDFQAKADEWKMASEKIKQDNQDRIDQYNSIMKAESKNADMMLAEFKLAAGAWGDEMMFNAAESKRLDVVAALLERQIQFKSTYDQKTTMEQIALSKAQAQIKLMDSRQEILQTFKGNDRAIVANLINEASKKKMENGEVLTPTEAAKIALNYKSGTSQARSLGTYIAKVDNGIEDAKTTIPNVLKASEGLTRGDLVPVNSWVQMMQYAGSNQKLIALKSQLVALQNAYLKVMNPSSNAVVGQTAELHLHGLFDAGLGRGALQEQIKQVELEMGAMQRGTHNARAQLGNDAEVDPDLGMKLFDNAIKQSGVPDRTQGGGGQEGGSNVDPWNDIQNFKVH